LYELDPESADELDQLCKTLGSSGEQLREAVKRVCENPSGRREPQHRFTRKFHNPGRYAPHTEGKLTEFRTNQWRGLFQLVEVQRGGNRHRLLVFVPVKGRRFFSVKDCPWRLSESPWNFSGDPHLTITP
jgi:hypothetical protein